MKEVAELVTAVGQCVWPIGIIVFVALLLPQIRRLLDRNGKVGITILGNSIILEPTKAEWKPDQEDKPLLPAVPTGDAIPADYYFLNHTSFVRKEKQKEYQERFDKPGETFYDIRVILDSYYEKALERVKYVVYFLHETYPEPVQGKSNRKEKFQLKELATGEYCMLAEVHLVDRQEPIVLQRHITLWESGPKLLQETNS